MKPATNASASKIICSLLGHRFKILKIITVHTKEYKCDRCGKEVTTNTLGNIVPLTDKLKTIHQGLESLVVRRKRSMSTTVKTA